MLINKFKVLILFLDVNFTNSLWFFNFGNLWVFKISIIAAEKEPNVAEDAEHSGVTTKVMTF